MGYDFMFVWCSNAVVCLSGMMIIYVGISAFGAHSLLAYSSECQSNLEHVDFVGPTHANFTLAVVCALSVSISFVVMVPFVFLKGEKYENCLSKSICFIAVLVLGTQIYGAVQLTRFSNKYQEALTGLSDPLFDLKLEQQSFCNIQEMFAQNVACNNGQDTEYVFRVSAPDRCQDTMLNGTHCGMPSGLDSGTFVCFVANCSDGHFDFTFDKKAGIIIAPAYSQFVAGILCVYSYWLIIIAGAMFGSCVALLVFMMFPH